MDIERLRKSFEKVASCGDEVPLFFYSHLFLSHPETRAMFPVSMMQQRDRLFAALGHIVGKVDDADALVPYLQQLGRDHRKFGTLAAHYPAVGASLLATLKHFAGEDWTDDLAEDWAAAYGLVAQVMSEAADEAADSPPWWDAKVISHERRTMDIAVLRVQPDSPLEFQPGQSVSIETELRPRLWRSYSIAGVEPETGILELHVQAIDGGPVSSALVRHVKVGDRIRIGSPIGQLVLDADSDRDLLLIAGGTGLAPLKALVQQVAQSEVPRRVDLYHGARLASGLYDEDELRALEAEHRWFTVTTSVSEDEDFDGERGSVSEIALRDGPWSSRDVYVCGSPAMVQATVEDLRNARVPQQRIRCEEFTASWPGRKTEGDVGR